MFLLVVYLDGIVTIGDDTSEIDSWRSNCI